VETTLEAVFNLMSPCTGKMVMIGKYEYFLVEMQYETIVFYIHKI